MIDNKIVRKVYDLYKDYGVEEKTIIAMMETGITFSGVKKEIVVYNTCAQLADEYGEEDDIDPLQQTAQILGVTADELLPLVM